jgi:dethiobiotin synthetase
MKHYFITGTDTDAGKTYVTCLLLGALHAKGESAAGFKPVSCGSRDDALALLAASNPAPELDTINPLAYRQPLAPMAAALLEQRPFDSAPIWAAWQSLTSRHDRVLVEGAGGWEVPLAPGKTVGDLAAEFNLPVVVVAPNRLGALNHTILTVRAIHQRGLTCAGIILNHVHDERDLASISNRAILESMLGIPVLAEIMHGETSLDWNSLGLA